WECWWQPSVPPTPLLSGSGTTNAQGQLVIDLPADLLDGDGQPITRSLKLTIEATATGKDNQVIAGRENVIVHAGEIYLGLAAQSYVGEAGKPQQIELVVADTQARRVPNQAVGIEIFRYTWDSTFIKNEFGGGSWEWREQRTSVERQAVTADSNGAAVIAWTPSEGGSYQVVATTTDSGNRSIKSTLFVWVAGDTYVSWRRENNDRFNLIADRTSYQPGETAEILIPSPFQGPHWALISVERGGILSHEVRRMEGNSTIYRLPLTAAHAPNVFVSVVLFTGSDGPTGAAGYKVGILPLAVAPVEQTLNIALTPSVDKATPGQSVSYAVQVTDAAGQPVATELSLDLVDKAVLSLLPRTPNAIGAALYGRRGLGVTTANALAISADRLQAELEQDLEEQQRQAPGMAGGDTAAGAPMQESAVPATGMVADGLYSRTDELAKVANAPGGLTVRGEFADTAYWNPSITTDAAGRASVEIKLPDNLTTWVLRGVGLTGDTSVGEGLSDLVVTKPLLVRPVTPRFLVVEDVVDLAANISNNTASPLETQVALATTGLTITSPLTQTVTIPANGEVTVTWQAIAQDVEHADLVFSAVAGQYSDASKPRLATGPDGSLPIYRYSAPETVGTGGQLEAAGSRTEVIALPSSIDTRSGALTVRLDPSLAAGMRDSLDYLEHYDYEGAEQTVSSFLPNVLTARALKQLGVPNAELEARLPALVAEGLGRLYNQQHDDGGWGWWVEDASNPHTSAYVVFALLRAKEAGYTIKDDVISRGLSYLSGQLQATSTLNTVPAANQQAWLLYVLGAGQQSDPTRLNELYGVREKLSAYARALLALALHADGATSDDARIKTLLSDLNNAAIISANGAHWEEDEYDWWSMNTDTRSTAIILAALVQLDPANQLNPNIVRWLMVARKDGIWETTQESAWSIMALTDWMVHTGELKADYDYAAWLNDGEQAAGHIDQASVDQPITLSIDVARLLRDQGNRLTIGRGEGAGRLYYSAYLRAFLPVETIKALDRGVIVERRYTLASCLDGLACPPVSTVKLGDVVRVDLSIVAPHDLYYLALEDPLPAGAELIDTGLATTSLLEQSPSLDRQRPGLGGAESITRDWYWGWWNWYSRSELRDEKVALFADYLPKGSYLYSYTMRATTTGQFHVIPTTAGETYFPEVYGRGDGQLLTITR
nr:alpha-2-macroglobulin [Herpetosiphonaceae bacterium]